MWTVWSSIEYDWLKNELGRDLEIGGQLGRKRLGEIADGVVEVEDGGVLDALGLVDYGLHHIGVAVPAAHRSNPSETVQIPPPAFVEQVLPLPVHYV